MGSPFVLHLFAYVFSVERRVISPRRFSLNCTDFTQLYTAS